MKKLILSLVAVFALLAAAEVSQAACGRGGIRGRRAEGCGVFQGNGPLRRRSGCG